MTWALFAVILGIVFTPVVTWIISRQLNNGKVSNSPAETLWQASEALRNSFKEMLEDAQRELAALRAEMQIARTEVAVMRQEASVAKHELSRLRASNDELNALLHELHTELLHVRASLAKIQLDSDGLSKERLDDAVEAIRQLIAVLALHGIAPDTPPTSRGRKR